MEELPMAGDALVVVHTFNTIQEAELAKSALEAADIDAMVRRDNGGGMQPALAWAGVGVEVLVRAEDAQAAREVLDVPAKQVRT
jgi:hypothetical protein